MKNRKQGTGKHNLKESQIRNVDMIQNDVEEISSMEFKGGF